MTVRAYSRSSASKFLPFQEAREVVRSHGLKSWNEWLRWCADGRRPPTIPSHPQQFYGHQEWNGFPDWLGYERKRRLPVEKSVPPDLQAQLQPGTAKKVAAGCTVRAQCDRAKRDFIARASTTMFEAQALPHRSVAQIIYRRRGEEKWCPLILRSSLVKRRDAAVNLRMPKLEDGLGVFCTVTSARRWWFFEHAFLAQRFPESKVTRTSATKILRLRARDFEGREVLMGEDLSIILEAHKSKSRLLDDQDINTELYSHSNDLLAQSLMCTAVTFLRGDCGLDLRRPTDSAFDAHFVVEGKTITARCCISRHFYARIDIGFRVAGRRVRRCMAENCPDFVVGLVYDDKTNDPASRVSVLVGFYIFPREYMEAQGALMKDGGEEDPGKTALNIILPGMKPKRRGAVARQLEQLQYFVDLSSSSTADRLLAAEKARDIFRKYG